MFALNAKMLERECLFYTMIDKTITSIFPDDLIHLLFFEASSPAIIPCL